MINLRTVGRYLDEGIKLMLVKQLVIEKQNQLMVLNYTILYLNWITVILCTQDQIKQT